MVVVRVQDGFEIMANEKVEERWKQGAKGASDDDLGRIGAQPSDQQLSQHKS